MQLKPNFRTDFIFRYDGTSDHTIRCHYLIDTAKNHEIKLTAEAEYPARQDSEQYHIQKNRCQLALGKIQDQLKQHLNYSELPSVTTAENDTPTAILTYKLFDDVDGLEAKDAIFMAVKEAFPNMKYEKIPIELSEQERLYQRTVDTLLRELPDAKVHDIEICVNRGMELQKEITSCQSHAA